MSSYCAPDTRDTIGVAGVPLPLLRTSVSRGHRKGKESMPGNAAPALTETG